MLTPRQERHLIYIANYIATNGESPTQKEVAAHFDCCETNSRKHIDALIKKGLLIRTPNKPRSLMLVNCPDEDKRIAMALLMIFGNNNLEQLHYDLICFPETDNPISGAASAIFLIRQAMDKKDEHI